MASLSRAVIHLAVTAIWSIKSRIDSVISYVSNPEKTEAKTSAVNANLHIIDDVVEYAIDDLKTEKRVYVSGIRCDPEYAATQFQQTKFHHKKEDGILAFHGYQSFKQDEVDADTAHNIGVALAKELWGDRFEVVIATHLNTGHYHNHFVVNSVSIIDGMKFNACKESYRKMREVSDQLCKEHHLSVVEHPSGTSKHHAEWSAEQNGKPTYRGMTKADIDRAIKASTTMRDFFRVMDEMGYTLKVYKKNGERLVHPVAIPPGASKGVRLDRLGVDYTIDEITKRILHNIRKQVPFPEAETHNWGKYLFRGSFKRHKKVSGLRALYFYYCYQLKTISSKPASVKRVPVSLREDLIKMDQRIEEMKFLGKNQIETGTQLVDRRIFAEQKITELADIRREQRNALKRLTRIGDVEEIAAVKAQISALSTELKQYGKEVKLCNSIAERSGLVKETLDQIIQQKINERKENYRYEPSKRRSGTDRQNVTWYR